MNLEAARAREALAAVAYREEDWPSAAGHFEEAVRLGLDTPNVHAGLGTAYMFLGRTRDAISEYQLALERHAQWPIVASNLIFLLDHQPETTLESALKIRKTYQKLFEAPLRDRWRPHPNDPDPERPLRIGYVSGDFRAHSAAAGILPILFGHGPGYRPVCYYAHNIEDETVKEFEAQTEFHRVVGLTEAQLAAKIREDAIDVLVDLSGHSAKNRLITFCLRPAPVQVTGFGYATGTGLRCMDGFFADAVTVPPTLAARGYVEPILRLPAIAPYAPSPWSEQPAPLPCLSRDVFTFGSFNRWLKITPAVLDLWAQILAAVPGSRMILKEKAFEAQAVREEVLQAFARRGVGAERVEFRFWTSHRLHLQTYDEIDLALDPFPHSGGITALDGFHRGVPAVTLLGERVPERLSASYSILMGLPWLVTRTPAEYAQVTIALTTEKGRARLVEIRATLQRQVENSPLCVDYAASVEAHYRALWRAWCQRSRR